MNLKEKRLEKHITLIGVSGEININRDTFSRIEKGISDLPAKCVKKLANIYGITPEEILELHEKDIELHAKRDLIEQIDNAKKFLDQNDRKYVKGEGR